MPSIGEIFGYKIYFYSNENDPLEPVHVHMGKNMYDQAAKVWICSDGSIEIAYNHSIPERQMEKIVDALSIISEDICNTWFQYFDDISYFDRTK